MKATNKQLIQELLPIAKEAYSRFLLGKIMLDEKNYYKQNSKTIYINGYKTIYTERETIVIVECVKLLKGKYDNACVSIVTDKGTNKIMSLGYSKEFRRLGNGYYADIDIEGKIIRAEWD